jgi:hypothetical protein
MRAITFVEEVILLERTAFPFGLEEFKNTLFELANGGNFESIALEVFRYQFQNNPIYKQWCLALGKGEELVHSLADIPFLPISFFKTHKVYASNETYSMRFLSSGTGTEGRSKHFVRSLDLYHDVSVEAFQFAFGKLEGPILALLPHYLENGDSSLVEMCRHWMDKTQHPASGFYLKDKDRLIDQLQRLEEQKTPAWLIGVSYALLDLAVDFPLRLKYVKVMETGGMKGRGREMIREELHAILKEKLGCNTVYSEYGMTELLSQAYYKEEAGFDCPPWMKIRFRDPRNPLDHTETRKSGVVNIIDLANVYSCSFIATDDLGRKTQHGFEIVGRLDTSDLRGCNLLI